MTVNVPTIKVKVDSTYLTKGKSNDLWNGYLVAVQCLPSRPLLFTVHLENGALFSGLPVAALFRSDVKKKNKVWGTPLLQPWSCLETLDISVLEYNHLKNYQVFVNSGDIKKFGQYMFTINYGGKGLSEDPEQHKSHNIVSLDHSGQFCAMPNNFLSFMDKYFYDYKLSDQRKLLSRNSKYYLAGG